MAEQRISIEDLEWVGNHIDDLVNLVEKGPVWDGDVVSKAGRDALIERGFAVRVVRECKDGYTGATMLGASLYRMYFGGKDMLAESRKFRLQGERKYQERYGDPKK